MNLKKLREYIEERKTQVVLGLPVFIPQWKEEIGVMAKGDSYLITAGPGVGKSSFVTDKFMLDQIAYLQKLKDKSIKAKWYYFSLEDTELRMELRMLSGFIAQATGVKYSYGDLINRQGNGIIDIDNVSCAKELVDTFNQHVEIISNIKKPKDIINYIQKAVTSDEEYLNTNSYHVVIIDNLKVLEWQGDYKNLKSAIDDFTLQGINNLKQNLGIIPIILQHQSSASDKAEYDHKGELKINSIKPSMESLADSTDSKTPATHIITLFNPFKYRMLEYQEYDINIWQDKFRTAELVKARDGVGDNRELPFFFDGKIGKFTQIEESGRDFNYNKKLYDKYFKIIEPEKMFINNNTQRPLDFDINF